MRQKAESDLVFPLRNLEEAQVQIALDIMKIHLLEEMYYIL